MLDWMGSGPIMSIMIAEVYKALVEAGAPEDSARAAASSIPIAKDLASKQDIAELRQEIAEVRQAIAALRAEMQQEIAALRAELKSDLKIIKFVYGPAVLLMLAKLVFFP